MDFPLKVSECRGEGTIFYESEFSDVVLQPDDKTKRLQKAINQIVLHQIDQTEASCLKALVLFRPGRFSRRLCCFKTIQLHLGFDF